MLKKENFIDLRHGRKGPRRGRSRSRQVYREKPSKGKEKIVADRPAQEAPPAGPSGVSLSKKFVALDDDITPSHEEATDVMEAAYPAVPSVISTDIVDGQDDVEPPLEHCGAIVPVTDCPDSTTGNAVGSGLANRNPSGSNSNLMEQHQRSYPKSV